MEDVRSVVGRVLLVLRQERRVLLRREDDVVVAHLRDSLFIYGWNTSSDYEDTKSLVTGQIPDTPGLISKRSRHNALQ